jgi:hypothetical protein
MVWLVDDLAEVMLGPWGLAIAAGVGVAALVRKQRESAGESASAGALPAGLGVGAAMSDRVKTRVSEIGEWWSDLYAEAHAEWEQERSAGTAPAAYERGAPSGRAASTNRPASTASNAES